MEKQQQPVPPAGIQGQIAQVEQRLDDLNNRLEIRLSDLERERECTITDVRHIGRAWVVPHPERDSPDVKNLRSDDEVENIAVQKAIEYEEARGWHVESVEADNRGFDLISRKPHPEDPDTAVDVRFIEVKGRAITGEVLLSTNEHRTAERLKNDYWLYVVFNCATEPEIHTVNDPAALGWKPIVKIEHYHVGPQSIKEAASE